MDEIKFVHFFEINEEEIIDLMNNEMVGKHMPLLTNGFTTKNCHAFLKAKNKLWDEYGFGPWAFLINGEFAGWGGLQPENGEADFGLVLHPKYWGWGRKIFNKVIDQAFNQMKLKSISILLPPSRLNSKSIMRLGFIEDGELMVEGEIFLKFRLAGP